MKDKFLEVVKEALELEDANLTFDDVLADFDEWDSMTRLSLIALLDEHFEVQISDAEFDSIETVQNLFEVVNQRMD
jgi:acyl carrier protein